MIIFLKLAHQHSGCQVKYRRHGHQQSVLPPVKALLIFQMPSLPHYSSPLGASLQEGRTEQPKRTDLTLVFSDAAFGVSSSSSRGSLKASSGRGAGFRGFEKRLIKGLIGRQNAMPTNMMAVLAHGFSKVFKLPLRPQPSRPYTAGKKLTVSSQKHLDLG